MSDEATFTMTLAGREIAFRTPHLGQILMLRRMATRAQKRAEEDGDDMAVALALQEAMIRTLDFIETLMVADEDKRFVEDKMLAGEIEYLELLKALAGGKGGDDTPDDEEPKTKDVKRTPKKAAKTVGSRARAKR